MTLSGIIAIIIKIYTDCSLITFSQLKLNKMMTEDNAYHIAYYQISTIGYSMLAGCFFVICTLEHNVSLYNVFITGLLACVSYICSVIPAMQLFQPKYHKHPRRILYISLCIAIFILPPFLYFYVICQYY